MGEKYFSQISPKLQIIMKHRTSKRSKNSLKSNLWTSFFATIPLVLTLIATPVSGQVFGPGPSIPVLFDNVIDLPSGPPNGGSISGGVGGDGLFTQVNVNAGGSITSSLMAPFVVGEGAEINIDGGTVGGSLEAHEGSEVNLISGSIGVNMSTSANRIAISGGSIGPFFTASHGTELNVEGGTIADEFTLESGSIANLSNGSIGNGFTSDTGAQVNISGGNIGDNFRTFENSEVNMTGGEIGNNFDISHGELNISDGIVGDRFKSRFCEINISGGEFGEADIFLGSVVNISGGIIGEDWDIDELVTANISGGIIGDDFTVMPRGLVNISGGSIGSFVADTDSQVNLFGTEFLVDGSPVVGLVGVPITITERDVTLLGLLADGSLIVFDLNSTSGDPSGFYFDNDATITVTLTGEPLFGDVNGDGSVDLLDIAPFVDLVTSGEFLAEADINQDKSVNLLDVSPFIDLLTSP